MLTNEIDEKKGFYKCINVEEDVRILTARNKNLYWVVLFACCREIYDPKKHCGGISLEEALAYNDKKVQKAALAVLIPDENDQNLLQEAQDGRGEGLLDYVEHQNFLIIYGTPPGQIVAAETKMVNEIADIMTTRYDKKFFVLEIPHNFNHLFSGDAVFETAVSSTI